MFQPYVSTLIISGNNRKLKGRVTCSPWYVPTTKQKKAPKGSLIVFSFLFFFEIIVTCKHMTIYASEKNKEKNRISKKQISWVQRTDHQVLFHLPCKFMSQREEKCEIENNITNIDSRLFIGKI